MNGPADWEETAYRLASELKRAEIDIVNLQAQIEQLKHSKCIAPHFGFEHCIGRCREPRDCMGTPLPELPK